MKLTTLIAAFAIMFGFAQSAQARGHHPQRVAHHHQRVAHHAHGVSHHKARSHVLAAASRNYYWAQASYQRSGAYASGNAYASSAAQAGGGLYGRRPAAWCGWQMRRLVSRDPGPSFNLARNWAHWGHAGPAGVGAVVVWPHHVGKIVGREGGMWVVQSGNDGHAVRARPRSIAGAIAIRWA